MGYETEADLLEELADLKALKKVVMLNGIGYMFVDGQGTMQVRRENISAIDDSIDRVLYKLDRLTGSGSLVSWRSTRR